MVLAPADLLIDGFRRFIEVYLSGRYQYRRFARLLEIGQKAGPFGFEELEHLGRGGRPVKVLC